MFKVIMRCSAGVQGEGSCSVLLGYAKWHEHLSVLVKWYNGIQGITHCHQNNYGALTCRELFINLKITKNILALTKCRWCVKMCHMPNHSNVHRSGLPRFLVLRDNHSTQKQTTD